MSSCAASPNHIEQFLLRVPAEPASPRVAALSSRRPASCRFFRGLVTLLAAVAIAFRPATAQGARDGDTLRIRYVVTSAARNSVEVAEGVLVSHDLTAFTVRPLDGRGQVRFAWDDVLETSVQRGVERRGWSAVGYGALIGVGVGAAIGSTAGQSNATGMALNSGATALAGGVIGGLVGALGGAMVAGTTVPNWESVTRNQFSAHVGAVGDGGNNR